MSAPADVNLSASVSVSSFLVCVQLVLSAVRDFTQAGLAADFAGAQR